MSNSHSWSMDHNPKGMSQTIQLPYASQYPYLEQERNIQSVSKWGEKKNHHFKIPMQHAARSIWEEWEDMGLQTNKQYDLNKQFITVIVEP